MAGFSELQLTRLTGELSIRNISGAILPLTQYGSYEFAVDEELNLLNSAVPATLRAGCYDTARTMVGRATVGQGPSLLVYELAQRINSGELIVTVDRKPDQSVLLEVPEG